MCTIQNRIWYSLLYKKNNCVLYKIEYGTVYYIKKQLCTIQNRIWYSLLYKKKKLCTIQNRICYSLLYKKTIQDINEKN